MIKSKQLYDALKFIAQIALPAFGTAYLGIAQIWDLSNGDKVVGTVVVVDTLLGALLGLSSLQYNKSDAKYDGNVVVTTNPDGTGKQFSLELNPDVPVDQLDQQKDLTFKVQPVTVDPPA